MDQRLKSSQIYLKCLKCLTEKGDQGRISQKSKGKGLRNCNKYDKILVVIVVVVGVCQREFALTKHDAYHSRSAKLMQQSVEAKDTLTNMQNKNITEIVKPSILFKLDK